MTDTSMAGRDRIFTQGPLYRMATWIYVTMAATAAMALAPVALLALPSVTSISAAATNASQLAGIIAIGPLTAATMYMIGRDRRTEDHTPIKDIWRGLRLNAREALALWAPFSVMATIVLIDLGAVSTAWRVTLAILAAVGIVWALMAMVVTAHFSFRLRDRARLGAFYLFAKPAVTLQLTALGVLLWWSASVADTMPWLLSGIAVRLVEWIARPVVADIGERFVHEGSTA